MTSNNPIKLTARAKVRSIAELGRIARTAQGQGMKVVQCHGVFDLVHMGHVRHLEGARREGDTLIVTLTADRHVNKGPGRPIFAEALRAEMLAALEYVDWVGINPSPTAEEALDVIRPDIYVKGSDYENPEDDVTGKIINERDAVERHGGKMVITKDITFSSSALINRYLNVYDHSLRDYLNTVQDSGGLETILGYIEATKDYKVLMVGDAIIDEYQYVNPMGKSAKENMIATRFTDMEVFAGGVFAAANHVASFCREVEIITALGDSDSREEFIRAHLKPNVKLNVIRRPNVPTTRKVRFVDPGYMRKLFEVYHFDDFPLEPELDQMVQDLVSQKAPDCDLTIAVDFGHGLISPATIGVLEDKARFLSVNTQTNSANLGYNLITRYKRADFVCIDAPEAQLAVRDRFSDIETVVAEKLSSHLNARQIVVTHGKMGCVTWQRDGGLVRVPAFTKTVVDTVGAGDAFLSVASPLAVTGAPAELVGFVGNAAGAMKVGVVGHRQFVDKIALIKYITTLLK